ncbi:ATP-grasp domain-containing protein [Sutcliffiella deserti]|uniref:ATP-grasp domain-containing protein n=1 Tax=Sutcliffiella deserti TaxID=2875501 RepID=UPI001CC19EFD|nr:ATP-grasp domain-containing protein [Sutcliffiella deserti]
MRKINVLVTGIGGPTAQGVLRCLREIDHIHIVGADRRKITSGNQFCDTTYQIPRFTQIEDYKNAISEIVSEEKIEVIFPSLHEEIELFDTYRDEWGPLIAIPESDSFKALLDKEQVYARLKEANLDQYIPKFYGFNSAEELLHLLENKFPDERYTVAKMVSGYGAIGFALLMSREDYLDELAKGNSKAFNVNDYCAVNKNSDRKILMEYLDGMEYSVDVFLHKGEVVVAMPRERTGVSNGIVLDGKVIYDEELIQAASEIATAIASNGFLNIQFIERNGEYKFTDVNPRFCGSQVMGLGAEVNFPYLFIQYNLLNEYASVEPRWNTRMIRYRDHFFVYDE